MIRINDTVKGDVTRDQSVAVQALVDASPDGSDLVITEPTRASIYLRGSHKKLRTEGAGIIIGAAPLAMPVSAHPARTVNVLLEGSWLTVNAAIAATGAGAVGLRYCFRSRVERCHLTINQHDKGSIVAMVQAMGGNNNDCLHNVIEATTDDVEFGGIRWGGSNPDELMPAGNVIGNRVSKCGHTPIHFMTAGECAYNETDGTGQSNGTGIGVPHDVPGWRWLHHNTIRNSFVTFGGHGIQSDATPGVFTRRVIVEDNILEGGSNVGIYITRADGWIVRRNRITAFGNAGSSGCRGILVSYGSRNVLIDDNTLKNNAGGIHVIADAEGDVENMTIVNNHVLNTIRYSSFAVRGFKEWAVKNIMTHSNEWLGCDTLGCSGYIDGTVSVYLGMDKHAGKLYIKE